MAMRVGSREGGAEINVTPLVDVVLVLLIIFMVLSPSNQSQIPNAVPQSAEHESVVLSAEQLVLELRADGSALLDGELTGADEFVRRLRESMAQRTSRTLFIAVDDAVPYGSAVVWMALARQGGAGAVALQLGKSSALEVTP